MLSMMDLFSILMNLAERSNDNFWIQKMMRISKMCLKIQRCVLENEKWYLIQWKQRHEFSRFNFTDKLEVPHISNHYEWCSGVLHGLKDVPKDSIAGYLEEFQPLYLYSIWWGHSNGISSWGFVVYNTDDLFVLSDSESQDGGNPEESELLPFSRN